MALQRGETDLPGTSEPPQIPGQRSAGDVGAAALLASRTAVAHPVRKRSARLSRPTLLEASLLVVVDVVGLGVLVVATGRALVPFTTLAALGALTTWWASGLYRRRIALSVLDDLPALALGALLGLATAVTVTAPGWSVGLERGLLVGAEVLALGVGGRCAVYPVILRSRAQGHFRRRAVMVAAGPHGRSLAARIAAHPEAGIQLVGTVSADRSPCGPSLPVLGTPRELADILREHAVADVVLGYGGMASVDLVEVLRTCDRAGAEIYMVPRLFEMYTLRRGDDRLWDVPLVRLRRPAQHHRTWRVKRSFDVLAAALALVAASPVMALVALAVRWEVGPTVIFRQTRIGLNGQPFEMLKFRSMAAVSGDDPVAARWTVPEDRLGVVGRFIRRYSLDELPQLWNVLRGDMSLVGPRPERPEYVAQFCESMPWYVHRHRVPVGMTGLAAVNGLRGDTSVEERAHFDNWYIDNWSLWLDGKILVRTIAAVLKGTGG